MLVRRRGARARGSNQRVRRSGGPVRGAVAVRWSVDGPLRCVHPVVTLFEKLDAMARRYGGDDMEPDSFVRHYEDAAQIILAEDRLPDMGMTVAALAHDMLDGKDRKDIAALPGPDEPALVLADHDKRAAIDKACAKIAPMFWGPRVPLDEACDTIRAWRGKLRQNG